MLRRLPCAAMLVVLGAACQPPPAPAVSPWLPPAPVHAKEAIRRVCLQRGLGKPGVGGGSIVFETGPDRDGIAIDTVRNDRMVVPSENVLCTVPEQAMRICPGDGPAVDVRDGIAENAHPVGTMARGYPIAFYEYVSGGGPTMALVAFDGKARYVPAGEICHLWGRDALATSRATERFQMDTSVPVGPKAFRPRSLAAIKRIVIHNTESTLAETLHHFGREDANTSAHVVIDRDGKIYRVVEDQFTAFQAGSSKDALGGHNATSLGIEVVAYDASEKYAALPRADFFSDAQRSAVIALVDFWMNEYHVTIAPEVFANRGVNPGYADLEYSRAGLTIHRLTKADRGTNCPRLLFPDSPEGDETFFRWRETTFSDAARDARARGDVPSVSLTRAE